jgi:amidophosphoribosyltransferase
VDEAYLNKLEAARNDENRFQAGAGDSSDNGIIDLYNDED